ncbi:MAG: DegV family protein [Anaerolineae bacterium]|nr:DegV family protein [Anaerolineae bacterium]
MPRILIMTDSTCDLPAEWVRQYDIRVVPTYVQFDLESLADDGVELVRADFYRRLVSVSTLPTTSAPPLGQTIEVMTQALKDADHVIALPVSSLLSAIYNIFRLATERTDPSRVTLIDSRMVSMGLGWEVVIAAEMAQAGASPQEIEAAMLDLQPRISLWAALDTLKYLRRSGRVGWAAAMLGDLFDIKPVVSVSGGEVLSQSRVRTSKRAFQTLVDLARQHAPIERLAVLHTQYLDGARQLFDALADIHPNTAVAIVDVTPVIGVHVGPNGLGLAVVRRNR